MVLDEASAIIGFNPEDLEGSFVFWELLQITLG